MPALLHLTETQSNLQMREISSQANAAVTALGKGSSDSTSLDSWATRQRGPQVSWAPKRSGDPLLPRLPMTLPCTDTTPKSLGKATVIGKSTRNFHLGYKKALWLDIATCVIANFYTFLPSCGQVTDRFINIIQLKRI
jgi:hypothetical protein